MESLILPVNKWNSFISNDFEKGVFEKHKAIAEIKNDFLKNGAVYASMSGSGSSVYGFFENKIPENLLEKYNSLFCWYSK